MITSRELKLFEEKMQAEKCCLEQGGKILIGAVRRIRGLANLAENGIDDWSDYNAWDNWDRN